MSVRSMAAVVVMGGPMGACDTRRHPYLTDVMRLIDMAGSNRHVAALGRIGRTVFGRWADAIDKRCRAAE